MNVSPLVQPHHLARRAAIYIRQSTGHQVLTNLESRRLQEAMREHAHRLGWSDERIELVDADTGRSGATAAGRDAYRDLLSDVALGNVGVVLSYDSARLSRNCSDWYPLLDVCALKGCLVADRDGVYDPSSVNGRLLLGMKGILSEIELHTMRGRLTAGLHAKARRGELAMTLPAGYTRDDLGRAVKDPDVQVQEAISLVFATFVRQRSAYRVAVEFRRASLRVPRRWRSSEVTWDTPTTPKILSILKNPVYAGVYAYGRRRWKPEIDEDGRRRPRYRSPEEWKGDLRPSPSLRLVGDVSADPGDPQGELRRVHSADEQGVAPPRGGPAPGHRLLRQVWTQAPRGLHPRPPLRLQHSAGGRSRAGLPGVLRSARRCRGRRRVPACLGARGS